MTDLEHLQESLYEIQRLKAELNSSIRISKKIRDKPLAKAYEELLERTLQLERDGVKLRGEILEGK